MKVSAIITTRNRVKLLKRAISSVKTQTYLDIEIIVVDDGSDDGTDRLCAEEGVIYIYIPKGKSRGGNYARNLGLKKAVGEYVAFLDDDDAWMPTKIQKQVEILEDSNASLVYCGKTLEFVQSDGDTLTRNVLPVGLEKGDMSKRILYCIPCTTSTIMVSRSAIFEIGLFDENLGFWQEYELTIRLAQKGIFLYVNEPLIIYRIDRGDPNRLTNKFFEWKKAVRQIYTKHISLYQKLNMWETYHYRALVNLDAAYRCKNAGMILRGCFHYGKWYIINVVLRLINK